MGEDSWTELLMELANYQNEGIALYLENAQSSPEEIAGICCMVRDNYMRDYVANEEGVVSEIRFNKVK